MEKIYIYENDTMALFKVREEIAKEDGHFSTLSYCPDGDIKIVETKEDSVVVEYFYKQPKVKEHLYIYNCEKIVLKTPPKFIPYNCREGYKEDVCIDRCLKEEIEFLWSNNIVTKGCCCGHGRNLGFIQVSDGCIDKMLSMGYQNYIYEDKYGGVERRDAFIPKSIHHYYDGYSDGHLG